MDAQQSIINRELLLRSSRHASSLCSLAQLLTHVGDTNRHLDAQGGNSTKAEASFVAQFPTQQGFTAVFHAVQAACKSCGESKGKPHWHPNNPRVDSSWWLAPFVHTSYWGEIHYMPKYIVQITECSAQMASQDLPKAVWSVWGTSRALLMAVSQVKGWAHPQLYSWITQIQTCRIHIPMDTTCYKYSFPMAYSMPSYTGQDCTMSVRDMIYICSAWHATSMKYVVIPLYWLGMPSSPLKVAWVSLFWSSFDTVLVSTCQQTY